MALTSIATIVTRLTHQFLTRWLVSSTPDVPAEAIDAVLRKVKEIEGGTLVARNAVFTDYLQCGVEASCAVEGEERTFLVKLVDFERPENNLFQVINQWTVAGKCVRHPEVVQAESRVHLREFLKKQNGIFFSTIQKFKEADDALSDRRDLIVIADEAHLGHYGFAESERVVRQKAGTISVKRSVPTARIIHDSLPNATKCSGGLTRSTSELPRWMKRTRPSLRALG